ncbi:hypothetical protein [Nevskia sp.]|uniref:Tse2 family ADP-ribosyltransferase toxin n=1 Tax=Nevskia sp. TaxID=1929292 RepID=UPI0025F7B9EE|nr:hypothetical protein [Nevskia sp.]
MYRSVRKDDFADGVLTEDGEAVRGVLHGDVEPRTIVVGGKKTTRQDWRQDHDGYFKIGQGTSLWDKRGVFGYSSWHYFLLPEGAIIPASLKLVKGSWSDRYQGTHWQIEVASGGELRADALRGALENLARNCVVRANELGMSLN